MGKNIVKLILLLICLPLSKENGNTTPKGSEEDILDQKISTTISASGDVNDTVTVGSMGITENPATETSGIGTQELSPSVTTATDEQLSTKLDETTMSETSELPSSMTSATATADADEQLSTKLDETTTETSVSETSSMTSATATADADTQLSTKPDGTEENVMTSETDVVTFLTPNDISTTNDDDTMTTSIESNVENTSATVSVPVTPPTALQSTAATTTGAFTVAPTSPTVLETSALAAETTASTLPSTDVTSTPNSTSTRGTALPKRQPTNEDSGSNTRVAVGIAVPTLLVLSIVLGIFCYKKLKKTGRGYITLDDFGTFEGMNNPNYDGEL